jgi:glycosyltransferase involved in cell wall biosynthesis
MTLPIASSGPIQPPPWWNSALLNNVESAIVVDLDARAVAAALQAGARHVYACFESTTAAGQVYDELRAAGLAASVMIFVGGAHAFAREVGNAAGLLIVNDAAAITALWDDITAGAVIFAPNGLPAAHAWHAAGFVERIANNALRATGKFPSPASPPADSLFAKVRANLLNAYFNASGESPVSITRPLREWRQSSLNRREWPFTGSDRPALPNVLPDGSQWPLISIVTPSFNQGCYIEETILSVANQRYPRIEHIVMDGGSSDSTRDVFARHKHRLAAAVSEKDRGQSHAINKGMALATGEILTWLNSDDMLAPDALSGVALAFHLNKPDLVAGIVRLRSQDKTTGFHLTSCEPGPLPLDDLLDLEGGWNAGQFFYQPEVLFTRDIFERAGGKVREDLYYSMDYDLWVRMAEAGARVHVIGREVAWFRLHENQKTNVESNFKTELAKYVADYLAAKNHIPRPPRPAAKRSQLRVTLLNDHGFHYGAGIAHRRLGETLALAGHEVDALKLRSTPPGMITRGGYDRSGADLAAAVAATNPDVVILGNVHSANVDPLHLTPAIRQSPTLAVLHDFWWITGRCAYPNPCDKYFKGCDETCPTAEEYPWTGLDKIAPSWAQKRRLLNSTGGLGLLGNSQWSCRIAREAGIEGLRVEPFRLSFPLQIFQPRDRRTCRAVLGLPEDRFIVMVSGDLYDRRKKTQLVLDALAALDLPGLTVVSLGSTRPNEDFGAMDVRRLGFIADPERLALYYSAADLYIAPSTEETFGQVFIESIACGTPVIGYRGSGMKEAIVENLSGLFIDELTVDALAAAIAELYRKPALRAAMAAWGRVYVENEWSAHASYYHLFQALRRHGIIDRAGLPRKISFVVEPRALPEPKPTDRVEGLTVDPQEMGPEEGPYPEHGLPRFRWAYGPTSRIDIRSARTGDYSLIIRYRNQHAGQLVTVKLRDRDLGTFPLRQTGIATGHFLCLPANLGPGANSLQLEFSRWDDPASGDRPLAAAITEISLLPDRRSA